MRNEEEKLDKVFQALANKHRRSIVYKLSLQPSSISELAKTEKLSLPAIHKHIKVLEETGFLRRMKSGRCNFLALNTNPLLLLQKWAKQYHTHWGNNKESLENYVCEIEKRSKNN